jgi:hypothetical protein
MKTERLFLLNAGLNDLKGDSPHSEGDRGSGRHVITFFGHFLGIFLEFVKRNKEIKQFPQASPRYKQERTINDD